MCGCRQRGPAPGTWGTWIGERTGRHEKRNPAADYTMIVAGTFLIGFAIKNIYDPVSMVTGGVYGRGHY